MDYLWEASLAASADSIYDVTTSSGALFVFINSRAIGEDLQFVSPSLIQAIVLCCRALVHFIAMKKRQY
jgi:hypothetical protein